MKRHLGPDELADFDELADGPRQEIVRHVAGCARCRAALLGGDPSRAFALLAATPLPEDGLERLSAAVRARIDEVAGGRRRPQRRAAVVGAVAAVALAAVLGLYLVVGRDGGRVRPVDVALERGVALPIEAVGRIDVLQSPGQAQVLDLSVGGTQVVMIFDRELDI